MFEGDRAGMGWNEQHRRLLANGIGLSLFFLGSILGHREGHADLFLFGGSKSDGTWNQRSRAEHGKEGPAKKERCTGFLLIKGAKASWAFLSFYYPFSFSNGSKKGRPGFLGGMCIDSRWSKDGRDLRAMGWEKGEF